MRKFLFVSYSDNEYLLQKVAAYSKVNDDNSVESRKLLEFSASLITPVAIDIPVIDEKTERAKLTPGQLAEIDNFIKMNLQLISRDCPLIADESVVSDRFTAISADYMDFPAGTPVLIRQTNKSKMIHFFPCSVYRSGNLEQGRLITESQGPALMLNTDNTIKPLGPESIIFSFFEGMTKSIGEKAGADIYNAAFPGNSTDERKMFQDLEQNIQKIFRKELEDQTIKDLNLKISGVIRYMKEVYLPQKPTGDVVALEHMLTQENERMYTDLMALLVGETYRSRGIAYFVVGANAHLGILQELVSITKKSNPVSSKGYEKTYLMRFQEYINTLTTAIEEVHVDRLTYLSPCQESSLKGVSADRWWFVDNWAPFTSDSYSNTFDVEKKKRGEGDGWSIDAEKKANNARTDYFNKTFHPKIVSDLQVYVDMKNSWQNTLGKQ